MAKGRNIKGITIEIGGDTTKLSKALSGTNKEIANTKSSLKDVERLLKLDPSNTQLLTQKQRMLTDAVSGTEKKLTTLKTAAQQAKKQLEMGKITQGEFDDLQREIIDTTNDLEELKKQAKGASPALQKLANAGDSIKSAGGKISKVGTSTTKGVAKGIGVAVGAATAAGGALVGLAKGTEEMRVNMAKYTTAFETAGFSAKTAEKTWTDFYGILGDSDQSTEAVGNLAKLCNSEKGLATWTKIATGVYATFGDGLPIEGLTEAANETAKVGQVTGPLADALNWAGVSEDEFNKKLEACGSEQERTQLITKTLNGLYSDAAEKYGELNGDTVEARKNQAELNKTLAEAGAAVQPLLNQIMRALLPIIKDLSGYLQSGMKELSKHGDEIQSIITNAWAVISPVLQRIPEVIGGIIEKFSNLSPTVQKAIITIAGIALAIGPVLTALGGLASGIGTVLTFAPKLTGVISVVRTVFGALFTVGGTLVRGVGTVLSLLPKLLNILKFVRTAFTALKVVMAANPIGLIVVAIGLLVVAFMHLWNTSEEFRNFWINLWDKIKSTVSGVVKNVVKWVTNMGTSVKNKVTGVYTAVKNGIGKAVNYIKELPSKALQWGKDFIGGFIDGIANKASELTGKISDLAGEIASFLHFSRPDIGPLHYYEQWMPDFMRGLAAGIEQNRGLVTNAISGLASDMTLSPSVQMAAGNASTTELRGLRAEVRQLRGALASMQVVMDTGATVGALAPEMDNALGRISSRRGRGN